MNRRDPGHVVDRWPAPSPRRTRRGLSRLDILVTIVALIVLLSIVSMMVMRTIGRGDGEWPSQRLQLRDATHLRGIHQAWLVASEEFGGSLPQPARLRPLPEPAGDDADEHADDRRRFNTTANLYSMSVAAHYFGPSGLISPWERNPNVREVTNYDWDIYDPMAGIHWDPAFRADLASESNVSYAHLLLFGARTAAHWRAASGRFSAQLGNRGPEGGTPDPASYTCDSRGRWMGNIVFGDGRIEWRQQMQVPVAPGPPPVEGNDEADQIGEPPKDNLFALEDGPHGEDIILTFTRRFTDEGPDLQHD